MELDIARGLKDALTNLDKAHTALESAGDEQLADAATAYQQARRDAGPAFDAAQQAFEADLRSAGQADPVPAGSTPPAEGEEPSVPEEASPGVPLLAAPGEVVSSANLGRYGALATFAPKENESEVKGVRATPYAFPEGTAVSTPQGTLAVTQPSRVIAAEGGQLAVVPNDVFNQTYEQAEAETVSEPPEGGPYKTGPDPESEVPVEGAATAAARKENA